MSRWKCVCAYDGGAFSGWQSQLSGNSVQDAIEARLGAVLGLAVRIHGSGRTDAGVHALAQVFHFDADWKHGDSKLAAALRHGLPKSIQIVSVRRAPDAFHARFSATSKTYSYRIRIGDADPFTRAYCWPVPRPLDVAAMRKAAAALRGTHDFKAFAVIRGEDDGGGRGTVRTLKRLEVSARRRAITVTAEADGFLYKMVRSLVGALVACGDGRLEAREVRAILDSKIRTAAVQTAPSHGLFLVRVGYR